MSSWHLREECRLQWRLREACRLRCVQGLQTLLRGNRWSEAARWAAMLDATDTNNAEVIRTMASACFHGHVLADPWQKGLMRECWFRATVMHENQVAAATLLEVATPKVILRICGGTAARMLQQTRHHSVAFHDLLSECGILSPSSVDKSAAREALSRIAKRPRDDMPSCVPVWLATAGPYRELRGEMLILAMRLHHSRLTLAILSACWTAADISDWDWDSIAAGLAASCDSDVVCRTILWMLTATQKECTLWPHKRALWTKVVLKPLPSLCCYLIDQPVGSPLHLTSCQLEQCILRQAPRWMRSIPLMRHAIESGGAFATQASLLHLVNSAVTMDCSLMYAVRALEWVIRRYSLRLDPSILLENAYLRRADRAVRRDLQAHDRLLLLRLRRAREQGQRAQPRAMQAIPRRRRRRATCLR